MPCWYDPERPARVVLTRHLPRFETAMTVLGLVILAGSVMWFMHIMTPMGQTVIQLPDPDRDPPPGPSS